MSASADHPSNPSTTSVTQDALDPAPDVLFEADVAPRPIEGLPGVYVVPPEPRARGIGEVDVATDAGLFSIVIEPWSPSYADAKKIMEGSR